MTARKTKRRFVECTDGRERCQVRVTVWLDRSEAEHFTKLAECEGISFANAVERSAQSGIRDLQPLEAYGYGEPAK